MKGAPLFETPWGPARRAIAFLGIPLLILLLVQNDLNQDGWIDPFVYLGYARDYAGIVNRYAHIYYATRLSHILPNALAFAMLGDHAGYIVLRYLQLVAAAIAIQAIARHYADEAIAWLLTIFFCSHPWLLRALLWDHYEGIVVVYALVGLALVLPRRGHEVLRHGVAGVAFAAALVGNPMGFIVAAAYAPTWFVERTAYGRGEIARSIAAAVAGFVAGYLLLYLALLIVSPRVGWTFDLAGVAVGTRIVASYGKTYFLDLPETILKHQFYEPLILVFSVVVAAAAFLIEREVGRRRKALGALAFAGTVAVVFAALHLMRVGVLSLHYYLIYALPSCLVALAALVGHWPPRPTRPTAALLALLVVAQAAFWSVASSVPAGPVILTVVALVLGLAGLSIVKASTGSAWPSFAATASVVLLATNMLFLDPNFTRIYGDGTNRTLEWDVRDGAIYLQDFVNQRVSWREPVYFWYDAADSHLVSVQSIYLFNFSRLAPFGPNFVPMPQINAVTRELLAMARYVVVLGSEEQGERALEALERAGYRAAVTDRTAFRGRQWPGYSALFIAITP